MRLVAATLYALDVPFVEGFRHRTHERSSSDSVVVCVRDDAGTEGFGECCPRPYVTGETVPFVLRHVAESLWPAASAIDWPDLDRPEDLDVVDSRLPAAVAEGVLCDHASRAAFETAVLDCALRRRKTSLSRLLPPRRARVTYSGVVTAGSVDGASRHARQMKLLGLTQVKVKVGFEDDVARLRAIREVLGDAASIRADANGAWDFDRARAALRDFAPLGIAAVEQPLPRGPVDELAALQAESPLPLMADESLVTEDDARELAAKKAVAFFNVRLSKCGGLARSRRIARSAAAAGIGVQVGCQVGETAILSAAGRHLAAALDDVAFVEGSYGTLLLAGDVSDDPVRFGHRGEAGLLTGPGLGIRVSRDRLRRYAREIVDLPAGGRP